MSIINKKSLIGFLIGLFLVTGLCTIYWTDEVTTDIKETTIDASNSLAGYFNNSATSLSTSLETTSQMCEYNFENTFETINLNELRQLNMEDKNGKNNTDTRRLSYDR